MKEKGLIKTLNRVLRQVDPVQRGPFRAVDLEGVDMGVIGGHGLRFYTPFSVALRKVMRLWGAGFLRILHSLQH